MLGGGFDRVSVASDGRDYLVAWQCPSEALGPRTCLARVNARTGAVTPGATIEGANPAIASDGSGYLVVAQQGTGLNLRPITAVAVSADGAVEGEPFHVASSSSRPEVASNGRDYLAVWSTGSYLDAVLISKSAVVGAPQRFTTFAPANGPGPFGWSVASDGDVFLVAWRQNRKLVGGVYQTDLRVSRVSREGIAGELHSVVGAQAWEPALTWIGRYLLTWTYSASPAQSASYSFSPDGDVRGLTIDDSAPRPHLARSSRQHSRRRQRWLAFPRHVATRPVRGHQLCSRVHASAIDSCGDGHGLGCRRWRSRRDRRERRCRRGSVAALDRN